MITESVLRAYLDKGMNIWAIMDAVGCCKNTVRNDMARYGIQAPVGFFSKGGSIGRPKGIPMSEEQKELRREMFAGEGNPFFGCQHTDETRAKMSENHADVSGDKNPFRRSLMEDDSKRVARGL